MMLLIWLYKKQIERFSQIYESFAARFDPVCWPLYVGVSRLSDAQI